MKVSIITVSYNSANTITDTINSVLNQTYPDIEYIVVDGMSTDGTIQIIEQFKSRISHILSEPDSGIYDAINKGIKLATGEIIGILNSDDFFFNNNVISKIVESFNTQKIDAVFGDVQFVSKNDISKVVRYYSSKSFKPWKFRFGFMPAHPSFYVRKKIFEKYGLYKTQYKIASDFELLLRYILIEKINYKYIELPIVSMRTGGVSNKALTSKFTMNKEIANACKLNGLYTNYLFIYLKYIVKLFEFSSIFISNHLKKETTNQEYLE